MAATELQSYPNSNKDQCVFDSDAQSRVSCERTVAVIRRRLSA